MPQFETVQLPPRLPLVIQTKNRARSVSKDARLVNCYVETDDQQELWVRKRPGLFEFFTSSAGVAMGANNWRDDTYMIRSGTMYRNGVAVAGTVDTNGGMYRFSAILGATPQMVFGNGKKTYAYTVAGGITADLNSIDADFPSETCKGIVYLNGATYVMDLNGQIWGSAINSVSVAGDWTALNFIAAQAEPDKGRFLAKQKSYVVAMGEWSTEMFYDAGNPAASPLGRVDGSQLLYGCAAPDSVQEMDGLLLWISSTRSGAVQVSMLEDLNHQIISTKSIDRILQSSTLAEVYSLQLKIDGHFFYMITLKDINVTLVYDTVENEWHQWTDHAGNYFKMVSYTYDSSKRHIMQHESTGKAYYCSSTYVNDFDNAIVVDIITPIFDANTVRRKMLKTMTFVGDQDTGSILQVRCTDDDYKTWDNYRTVNLDQESPLLMDEGTFVRRAYHFRHRSNTTFRMSAVDVQYDLGTL